jgi:hypothetical protein
MTVKLDTGASLRLVNATVGLQSQKTLRVLFALTSAKLVSVIGISLLCRAALFRKSVTGKRGNTFHENPDPRCRNVLLRHVHLEKGNDRIVLSQ